MKAYEVETPGAQQALVCGLKSVHGVISVPVGNPLGEADENNALPKVVSGGTSSTGFAIVEACSGSIIVRHLDSSTYRALLSSSLAPALSNGTISSTLTFCGVMNGKEALCVERVFELCGRHLLTERPTLTRQDVAKHQIFAIQRQMEQCNIPLPVDCWWNGTTYVDHMGTSQLIRPDIEPHIEMWLQRKNKKICEYNNVLEKVQGLL